MENLVSFVIFVLFKIFQKIPFFLEILILLESLGDQSGEVGSASPPGGNLVDGLPPASSTETVAKRARLGGCA